ncbi:MAG: YtxH domain-containing protein [Cyanobacteriota bacterium]|nr:YtxH domain-containing protein [Cyanobacteriota bacterium]MDY6359094.1 YtxH domain-containing protein [Cyanobacteriota bacterium]MDY6364851.1 YtxH domain-containing protein [Cyanobacteriota bacterium]MDY6383233.1 YtxH domain-containing protein [Cyanobacteriota bacterium]
MDNSVLYGLRNPAFTEDYPMSIIGKQFATNIDPIDGLGSYNTSPINPGQPQKDIFQSKKQKEYSAIKKVAFGLGAIGAAALGIKFAPKAGKAVFNKIAGVAKKGFGAVSDFFKKIYHKIKK